MTRKDYVMLARVMKDNRPHGPGALAVAARDALDNVTDELADELSRDNPRFDRARFLVACGVAA